MSENINNNVKNNINPENIETIDFDTLESKTLDAESNNLSIKEKKIEIANGESGTADSVDSADIMLRSNLVDLNLIGELQEGEIDDDSPNFSDFSLPPLSFQEQIENDQLLREAFERVERNKEKNKNLVSLNKLGELKEGEIKYLQIGDACIEVHTSLPYREIVNGVQTTIALILDDRPYISEPIKQIVNDIFLLRAYTNLDFSFFEEIGFEPSKIYDIYGLLIQEDVINKVKNLIDQKQLDFWNKSLDSTLKGIINYKNSAMGIINNITEKQISSENSMKNIMQTLKDSENAEAIQNILKLMNVEDK